MFQNYLKIALRNFKRRPFYGLANMLGLTIGLASCGLIGLYIHAEWQVDKFHTDGDRLFRVVSDVRPPSNEPYILGSVGRPVAKTIKAEIPEVAKVLPIRSMRGALYNEKDYFFEDVFMAGEDFWNFFDFELLEGDPSTSLKDPFGIVITESLKEKLFGSETAMGKTLTMPLVNDTLLLTVKGIAADPPTSHIDFDALISLSSFYEIGGSSDQWFTLDEYCYIKLEDNVDARVTEEKLSDLSMKHAGEMFESYGYELYHELQAVPEIYLHSGTDSALGSIGDVNRLFLLGTIALLILIIACINFINLSTARVSDRAREVGIRKTIGASYQSLIAQFLGEALTYVLIATFLAIFLIESALPYFTDLLGTDFSLQQFLSLQVLIPALLFILTTGLISGWYPAIVQARLHPADTLKGRLGEGLNKGKLRKGLVVFQFGISMVLIFSTLVIFRQIGHMRTQELGFQKDQMLVLETRRTPRKQFMEDYNVIKEEILSVAGVNNVAGSFAMPGRTGWGGQVVKPTEMPEDYTFSMEVVPVDHDYIQTLGLTLVSGRDFSKELSTDMRSSVILNERACKMIGWTPEEAVGKGIWTSGVEDGKVIGVMADYHHHGLQSEVGPMALFMTPYAYNFLAIHTASGEYTEVLETIRNKWATWFPGYPFEYFFLDDDFDQQYKSEERMFKAFSIFAFLSIFTACLGLLGLAVYTAEKRTKEIGIRKVLGASIQQIIALLSADFLKLIGVALIIGLPIAWFAMHEWLQDFAYRISIQWWMFVISGGIILLIAMLTISFQALRAAVANPIESLRDE